MNSKLRIPLCWKVEDIAGLAVVIGLAIYLLRAMLKAEEV